ncbi:hypothetical protein N0V88_005310 [Collariella sp. IMI 366227]|nr:hypothetical protein N0V88_005310 [Collariella sp. IMI 366227]
MAAAFKSLLTSAKALAIGNSGSKASLQDLFPAVDKVVDGEDCDHDCESCTVHYPKGFKIEEDDDLYGLVKGWSTHVLVATGKTDWVRDVADEKGSVMQAIAGAKKPTNGPPTCPPPPRHLLHIPTTVLLLPAFTLIDNVSPATVPTLLTSIVSLSPTNSSPLTTPTPSPSRAPRRAPPRGHTRRAPRPDDASVSPQGADFAVQSEDEGCAVWTERAVAKEGVYEAFEGQPRVAAAAATAMSSMTNFNDFPPPASAVDPRHQRSKSSVLRSFIGGGHRRNNSDGAALPSAPLLSPIATNPAFQVSQHSLPPIRSNGVFHVGFDPVAAAAMEPQRYAHALGELQQNRQERSPERPRGRDRGEMLPPPSPTKTGFASISLKGWGGKDRDSSKPPKTSDNRSRSPTKPKKAKSATNLAALLRPKSIKNLKQLLTDESDRGRDAGKDKDKENRTPSDSLGSDHHGSMAPPPPIYAQFATQNFALPSPRIDSSIDIPRSGNPPTDRAGKPPSLKKKPRPKSFQAYVTRRDDDTRRSGESGGSNDSQSRASKRLTWGKSNAQAAAARPTTGSGSKSTVPAAPLNTPGAGPPEMPFIDPKDIDKHLEAMLNRRNIPENQRYKMRNLSNTIKLEFIRQDWAEMQAKMDRPPSHDGGSSRSLGSGTAPTLTAPDHQDDNTNPPGSPKKEKKKHSRGLSLTLVRSSGNKSTPSSPVKEKKEGKSGSSIGRHFRTKSSESLVGSEPPSPGAAPSSYGSSFLAKVKGQQLPGDFVAYLAKVRQPQNVEVGKLHKLRLLLRNETVAWTDEFIRLGGMKEIVELLHRIMAVEWREEHEDALLHENLLCLKALCTTDMALQYLHSIHATLFPALLHMIFDPEKKGPSEFTTRNIITSLLLTYIESAPTPQERIPRAQAVLGFLRDPEPTEEERPLDFVLEMRQDRPYRVPYVGGVEWDATNYLASHLDLLNALIACTGPSSTDRNALRAQLRISGGSAV